MSVKPISVPAKKLAQGITSASSSFKVNNIKHWARNSLGVNINLTAADFGTQAFCVFRNDTSTKIEIMEFDPATIASASITILKRGLGFGGDMSTETTAYKLDWSANETTINFGTDVPQLFQYIISQIPGATTTYTETPSGTINSVNVTFTTAHTINTILAFAINGQFIHPSEYSVAGTTITFNVAPNIALVGLPFTIIYQ